MLQCCYCHLWYIVPQPVSLSLVGSGLKTDKKVKMAKKLHMLEGRQIGMRKPVLPMVTWALEGDEGPDMSEFMTSDSWLIFDQLDLLGNQDS